MDIRLYIISGTLIVFFILWLVFRKRKWKLSQLTWEENESLLAEYENVRTEQIGVPSPTVYHSCKIQLSDKRMIIAQKILGKKDFALRYVIRYKDFSDEGIQKGKYQCYLNLAMSPKKMRLNQESQTPHICIPMEGHVLWEGQSILIFSDQIQEIWKNLHTRT